MRIIRRLISRKEIINRLCIGISPLLMVK